MTEKQLLEAIHKEIDGELTEAEKARLREHLAHDAPAQRLHRDLKRMSAALAQIAPETPSANLKKRIMNAIPRNRYAPQSASFAKLFFPELKFQLKHAYIFLFGLAIGVVATTVVINETKPLNPAEVGGSLMNPSAEQPALLKQFNFNQKRLSGTIAIKTNSRFLFSEINLQSSAELDIRLEFETPQLEFNGANNLQTERMQLIREANLLQLRGATVSGALMFLRKTGAESSLRLMVLNGDEAAIDEIIGVK
jgi:hypothetical protein